MQLTVTDSATSTPVTRFGAPVSLHLAVPANGLAPSFSTDGTTWKPLPKLTPGIDAGYTLLGDGTVEIDTLVPGYFGLLADTVPPSRPAGFTGRFVNGALRLSWNGATDNAGPVVSYDVLLDGVPSAHVAGSVRRVIVRAFHPGAQTVYRVRAIDAAGNASVASRAIVVVPYEAAGRRAPRAPALGVGPLRLPAPQGCASRDRAAQATVLVLALGGLALGALPREGVGLCGWRTRKIPPGAVALSSTTPTGPFALARA